MIVVMCKVGLMDIFKENILHFCFINHAYFTIQFDAISLF